LWKLIEVYKPVRWLPYSCFAIFRRQVMAKVEIVAVVLTISDKASRGEREDKSGPAVVAELEKLGGRIFATEILPDERELIASRLRHFADSKEVNLICTTGGTDQRCHRERGSGTCRVDAASQPRFNAAGAALTRRMRHSRWHTDCQPARQPSRLCRKLHSHSQ
jgi:hypothetical protein